MKAFQYRKFEAQQDAMMRATMPRVAAADPVVSGPAVWTSGRVWRLPATPVAPRLFVTLQEVARVS